MPARTLDTSRSGDHLPDGDAAAPPAAGSGPDPDAWLVAVTVLAVVAGVVLRFWPRSGLWLDEALTANISARPLGEIGDRLRVDGHPPLYYWLLHVWGRLGDSDGWLRALSGVIGAASLPLVYLGGVRVGRRVAGDPLGARRVGLVALALAAVLPYGVRYGSELRMYSLVIALAAGGYLLVDDLLTGRRQGAARAATAAGAALVAGALLWTHYWSMWLLGAVGLLALWRAGRDPVPARRDGARWLVGALVVGGVLFLPWVPTMLYQAANTGTPWGDRYLPASVVVVTLVDFAGARFGAAQFLSYLLVTAGLAGLMVRVDPDGRSVIAGRPQPRVRTEFVVTGLALGLGSSAAILSSNTFASRYAAIVFALFVLIVAAGLCLLRSSAVVAVALAGVVGLSLYGGIGEAASNRSQSGEVAAAIAADVARRGVPDSSVVVVACPDQLAVSLQRELDALRAGGVPAGDGDVVAYPGAGDPRFVDWVDYAERNAEAEPAVFVARLGDVVADDATIYLYSNATYRTVESKCDQLLGALAPGRPVEQLVVGDPDRNYEFGDLRVLGPRS